MRESNPARGTLGQRSGGDFCTTFARAPASYPYSRLLGDLQKQASSCWPVTRGNREKIDPECVANFCTLDGRINTALLGRDTQPANQSCNMMHRNNCRSRKRLPGTSAKATATAILIATATAMAVAMATAMVARTTAAEFFFNVQRRTNSACQTHQRKKRNSINRLVD